MDGQIEKLYQNIILDHSRNPRNFGIPKSHSHFSKGVNRLCGDEVSVYFTVVEGNVVDLQFQSKGCALCIASASLMSELINQQTLSEVVNIARMMLAKKNENLPEKLTPLTYVWNFPARVRCVSLAWETFVAAVESRSALE